MPGVVVNGINKELEQGLLFVQSFELICFSTLHKL